MFFKSHLRLSELDDPKKFIKKTLQLFANFDQPQKQWLDIYLLASKQHDYPHQAFDELEQLIKEIILLNLERSRSKVRITSPTVKTNHVGYKDAYADEQYRDERMRLEIKGKQSSKYTELKKWSVLYHNYFVVHNLNIQEFEEACGVSDRNIRNHITAGIQSLTQQLISIEDDRYIRANVQQVLKPHTLIEQTAESLISLAQNSRSLDGEALALKRCDDALQYAFDHQLPVQYIKAVAIKAFVLLQEGRQGVIAASALLEEAEYKPLIKYLPDSPKRYWVMAKIYSMKAHVKRRQSNLDEARSLITTSIEWLTKLHDADPALSSSVYTIQAVMNWASGYYDEAISSIQGVLKRQPETTYASRELLGLSYWSMCEYDKAEHHFQLTMEESEARHDRWHLACASGNLGLVYLSKGMLQHSQTHIEYHRNLAEELGSWKEHKRATANLGVVYLYQGKNDLAISMLEQSKTTYDNMSAPESQVNIYANLSQAYTIVGHHEKALELAQQSKSIADSILGAYPPQILALRCLGECELLDRDERIRYLQLALPLCQNYRSYDKAAIMLSLAYLSTAEHEPRTLVKDASIMLKQIGAHRWLNIIGDGYPHLLLLA